MLIDTELFDRVRREEMKRLGADEELLRQVIVENPPADKKQQRDSLAWLSYWERENEERRLRKQAKEKRRKWEERQHKIGALHKPKVNIGFQGEFNERFKLHCEIPEQLHGFDLAEEIYYPSEIQYDSVIHFLRAKWKKE
jgi:hypothetical protein